MLSFTGTARKRSLDHLDRTRKRIGQGKAAIGEVIKQSRSKPVSRKARLLDVGGRNPARHRLSAGGIRTLGPSRREVLERSNISTRWILFQGGLRVRIRLP